MSVPFLTSVCLMVSSSSQIWVCTVSWFPKMYARLFVSLSYGQRKRWASSWLCKKQGQVAEKPGKAPLPQLHIALAGRAREYDRLGVQGTTLPPRVRPKACRWTQEVEKARSWFQRKNFRWTVLHLGWHMASGVDEAIGVCQGGLRKLYGR